MAWTLSPPSISALSIHPLEIQQELRDLIAFGRWTKYQGYGYWIVNCWDTDSPDLASFETVKTDIKGFLTYHALDEILRVREGFFLATGSNYGKSGYPPIFEKICLSPKNIYRAGE